MNSSELMFIKNAQKEFRARFNRELEINFEKMNGVNHEVSKPVLDELFQECLEKFQTTKELVCNRNNRRHSIYFDQKASACIKHFIHEVNEKGLCKSYAALLINRDRGNFYDLQRRKNNRQSSISSDGRFKSKKYDRTE